MRVRYAVYESNEEMLARVMSGNSGWDVVFPTSYLIQPMRVVRAARANSTTTGCRTCVISTRRFSKPVWDPELRWGVPYMWRRHRHLSYEARHGRRSHRGPTCGSPSCRAASRCSMIPVDVFGACLKKLGYSINTQNPDELRAAQQEAIEQKELLRAYINAEVRDQLVAGDVLAAQLWSTTAQQAMDEAKGLAFVYPEEGFLLYADIAVILRESKRTDLAHEFLNYLLRPEVAAGIVMGARAACPNGSARALLPEDTRNLPTLYPSPEIMARGEWSLSSTPEIQRLRDRLWTEIKSA